MPIVLPTGTLVGTFTIGFTADAEIQRIEFRI